MPPTLEYGQGLPYRVSRLFSLGEAIHDEKYSRECCEVSYGDSLGHFNQSDLGGDDRFQGTAHCYGHSLLDKSYYLYDL